MPTISGETAAANSRPRVLIVPHAFLDLSLRLPPMITRAGFDVDLLCSENHPLARSRYVDRLLLEKTPESLFARLRDILGRHTKEWAFVIVVDEPVVRRLIASGDSRILENWQKAALDPMVRDFLLGKLGLDAVYQSGLVQVPPSKTCHSIGEIQHFGETHGWPVIIKPPDASGGLGITRCDSRQDVEAFTIQPEFPVLVQKFLTGREAVVEMFCSGGKALAWLASYPTRRASGEFSHSTARLFLPVPGLQPLVDQVAKFTGFEGFCGFDCIEDENTGIHSLIEFHPRPTSGLRFASACGVDFSTVFADCVNGDAGHLPMFTQAEGTSVAAHYFSMDLERCMQQRDWRGMLCWLPWTRHSHDIYWDDFPMFSSWIRSQMQEMIGSFRVRLRRLRS